MFSIIKKQKALEPLIAAILLIVVAIILVTIVLSFGKDFTTRGLNKTQNFGNFKISDATHFVYPKSAENGIVQFTYTPPNQISEEITITHYRVLNIPEMSEPIALSESKTLTHTNIIDLPCLYEYSTTTPDLYIQLLTTDNTYIDIKTTDSGMVCSPGGDGSEANPKIICTAKDLNAVRLNLDWNYALGKDIDLQCFSRQDINGWEPIGDVGGYTGFTGLFDGKNYTIQNLYINSTDYSIGLFGYVINGHIKNLGVIDVNISTSYGYIGGLIGELTGGTIEYCYSTGEVSGIFAVGGLIGGGYEHYGPIFIKKSYSEANVYGDYQTGGLIGDHYEGTIENCYSKGTVNKIQGGYDNFEIGGFCGYAFRGIIKNSYSTGKVIFEGAENPTDKGFSGDYFSCSGACYNFWDMNTSEQTTNPDGATGKTTTQMKQQATFTDWDFLNVWAIDPTKNNGYPYLRNNPPR